MKPNGYTDQEILEAIKTGGATCEKVMEHLYTSRLGGILNFVQTRNGSEEEARDVFQDAIINLVMAVRNGKFKGESATSTYLYAIAKNLWYRKFKRGRLESDYVAGLSKDEKDLRDPEVFLVDSDQGKQLSGLMGQLKDKCREVLTLWAQKYAMKEIAEKVGYGNEQVVRNKKNACLKELKELVRLNPQVRNLIKELVS